MEVNREKGSIEVDGVLYTASAITRHNPDCKYAGVENNGGIASCNCRKSILVYNGATKKQDRISARTRSWSQATAKAEEWLDQFDPTKVEQKRQDAQAVTVEKAVGAFIADKRFHKLSPKTIDRNRALLGDFADGVRTAQGKLLPWLDAQNPPIRFLSEITSTHLLEWRNTWEMGDLTAHMAWGTVKEFFKFCSNHEWITKSPAANIKRPGIKKGSRTGVFTDKQFATILKHAAKDEKLKAFVLLLRWGAMAIVDATTFNITTIGDDGVLRYKRQKTRVLATVPLPEDVVAELRKISKDTDQPFRRAGIELDSNISEWRKALQDLFTEAGITSVATEVGERPPHPHMFRDTCAVYYLRKKVRLHSLARILGHSSTDMIQKHYAPWVTELEDSVIEETRAILAGSAV